MVAPAPPFRLAALAPEGTQGGAARSRPASMPLTDKIRLYAPHADIGLVEEAYAVAAHAHGAQTRDNGDPYITHPLAVADILAGYRLDVPSICTALLHDTVEDTPATLAQIERQFGATIAGLVDGVTKLTRLELQSDRTKQAENFRKLVLAMSRDIRVLLVKLADRLHNAARASRAKPWISTRRWPRASAWMP
jgi:guanosine-3',5'-bis(diphosphate) 3'-pyrophosphohydrolase